MNTHALFGTALIAAALGLAHPAAAQPAPSFGQPLGNETLDGIIVRYLPGTFELGLRDDRGFLDTVRLHDRTIILPIGVTLVTGMRVSIVGYNQGGAFRANEIDRTPPPPPSALPPPDWYAVWVGPNRPGTSATVNPPAPTAFNPPAGN